MDKSGYAVECFSNGCNCTQAVFTAYCTEYGIDKKLGLKLACSLGGGMGHTGQVCGAVSGALLVLGLKYGQDNVEDKRSKAMNYLIVQDFISRFRKLNGSINCTELLHYDLSEENQLSAAIKTDVFKTLCSKYVGDAVKILDEVAFEYDSPK
ncbi:MAG: C-GCAxxG-C-C family protein [Bacillota bacterium]|nr:C-GCAxxG-C-C family protein [Bacillota bacterium]